MNKIWITGNGMVGKALAKHLAYNKNYKLLFTNKQKLDQTNPKKTEKWIKNNKPNIVIISSALLAAYNQLKNTCNFFISKFNDKFKYY